MMRTPRVHTLHPSSSEVAVDVDEEAAELGEWRAEIKTINHRQMLKTFPAVLPSCAIHLRRIVQSRRLKKQTHAQVAAQRWQTNMSVNMCNMTPLRVLEHFSNTAALGHPWERSGPSGKRTRRSFRGPSPEGISYSWSE